MVKLKEKEIAIKLRLQGLSYTEILRQLPVAKSSLSLWLRDVGLAKHQKQKLTEKKKAAQLLATQAVKAIRIAKTNRINLEARKSFGKLLNDPGWLIGVILYWAEGSKIKSWSISQGVQFGNMDVRMIKVFRRWCKKYLGATDDRFIFELYIHESAEIQKAMTYWANMLDIKVKDIRAYLKKNNISSKHRNNTDNYNGLIRLRLRRSTDDNRKIDSWIENVVKYFS